MNKTKYAGGLAMILLVGVISCKEDTKSLEFVKHSYVCMTQDRVYDKPLIPVKFKGKTYYGCCEGCAKSIKANPDRFTRAIDPVTKKVVDKAEAYIVNLGAKVLYFSSKENAHMHFNR